MKAEEDQKPAKVGERAHLEQRQSRVLTVRTPGSTANLGPGFDALALALNIYCTLQFHLADEANTSAPAIQVKGTVSQALPLDANNLVFDVLRKIWHDEPQLLQRVRITIESDIPLGKGLGSSAAAIVGSIYAAYALKNQAADTNTLLSAATRFEGHPDNVSASLLGGLIISAGSAHSRQIITRKLVWPDEWRPIIVVPAYVLSTKDSRAVLPRSVPQEDAINNIQRVALLTSAIYNVDEEALKEALFDRLHEPYRLALVPELGMIKRLLADFPILGCVLSGAGPSVLTLVHKRHQSQVLQCLQQWACIQPQPPQVYDLQADQEGLHITYE